MGLCPTGPQSGTSDNPIEGKVKDKAYWTAIDDSLNRTGQAFVTIWRRGCDGVLRGPDQGHYSKDESGNTQFTVDSTYAQRNEASAIASGTAIRHATVKTLNAAGDSAVAIRVGVTTAVSSVPGGNFAVAAYEADQKSLGETMRNLAFAGNALSSRPRLQARRPTTRAIRLGRFSATRLSLNSMG